MTTTRFVLARRASLLLWLLPLGVAGLSMACGSSPGMVGVSAGAAGVNTGTAGADSTSGGSGSGHAGSPGSTPTAGATGEAGGSVGAGDTGGSSGDAGGSSGGASAAGAPSTGAAGSSSTAGAGGADGAYCVKDADCGAGNNCLYKIADGCAAKGSCFKMPGGALCASISSYCGCLGQMVGVPCYEPTGYSPAPVTGQESSATCPAGPDPRCAGKSCGAQCDNGEFPAACDLNGDCMPLFTASQCP
jgi:hypothetical protein